MRRRGIDPLALRDIGVAIAALREDLAVLDHHDHRARDVAARHGVGQEAVEPGIDVGRGEFDPLHLPGRDGRRALDRLRRTTAAGPVGPPKGIASVAAITARNAKALRIMHGLPFSPAAMLVMLSVTLQRQDHLS